MSTRAGEYVTLREVIQEVGKDAARFFFLMRKCDSHLDFDLELAKKESPENPVYYVLGQTEVGRYLFYVIIGFPDGKGYPVMARPMTPKEKRRFNQWKNR
jgi:hypothetical protein